MIPWFRFYIVIFLLVFFSSSFYCATIECSNRLFPFLFCLSFVQTIGQWIGQDTTRWDAYAWCSSSWMLKTRSTMYWPDLYNGRLSECYYSSKWMTFCDTPLAKYYTFSLCFCWQRRRSVCDEFREQQAADKEYSFWNL